MIHANNAVHTSWARPGGTGGRTQFRLVGPDDQVLDVTGTGFTYNPDYYWTGNRDQMRAVLNEVVPDGLRQKLRPQRLDRSTPVGRAF